MPHFITLCRYCGFYKLKVCGKPATNAFIGAIFPTALAHFLSLCHILIILIVFQNFSLLLYLLWCSAISDLWCYYCKKDYNSLKAQMVISFFSAINYLKTKVCTLFRLNAIAHLRGYSTV